MLSVTALSEEPFSRLQESIEECESGLSEWKEVAAHQGIQFIYSLPYRSLLTTTRKPRTSARDLQKNR